MMNMKNILNVLCVFISISIFSQTKSVKKAGVKTGAKTTIKKGPVKAKPNPDLVVINKDLPVLIPKRKGTNLGTSIRMENSSSSRNTILLYFFIKTAIF